MSSVQMFHQKRMTKIRAMALAVEALGDAVATGPKLMVLEEAYRALRGLDVRGAGEQSLVVPKAVSEAAWDA